MAHSRFWSIWILAFIRFSYATPTSSTLQTQVAASTTSNPLPSSACAIAASASSQFAAASPSATVTIPADVAYACLETIPNIQNPALDLLYALEPLVSLQSTQPYLQDPPSGYLFPPIDLLGGLEQIKTNVQAGAYQSEYDFQLDISAVLSLARDGHLDYIGDALGIFTFQRDFSLVSVSSDGMELPKVFYTGDLLLNNTMGGDVDLVPRNTSFTPSAVKTINGIDTTTFLQAQSLVQSLQDPDALYNLDFFELARATSLSTFESPQLYPGPTTDIVFINGSTLSVPNFAVVLKNLAGISNGADAYSAYCTPLPSAAILSAAATSQSVPTQTTSSLAPGPTVPGYPYPVVKHSEDVVSGYFLNGTDVDEVAVLAIPSYGPVSKGGGTEFQKVVSTFLKAARQAGKTKLIVDVQTNPGGIIDLGLDTFAQLFPSIPPNQQGNMIANSGIDIFGTTVSDLLQEAEASGNQSEIDTLLIPPIAVQAEMTLNHSSFASWPALFGPVQTHGAGFTNLFQANYTNPAVSEQGAEGIIISGTNGMPSLPQPFEARNIVILSDGFCASTCSIFHELMKTLGGVHSIAVGGRPQNGPMQEAGGVKGSQNEDIITVVAEGEQILPYAKPSVLAEASGMPFGNFTSAPLAVLRAANPLDAGSINIKNNIRIGDASLTPLQFVYEAADCRIWYTPEMLYDATFLWSRVASIAFKNGTFDSPYCVNGSTKQPTSLSGGLKNGTLGPQVPPTGATPSVLGWLINGTYIDNSTGSTPARLNNRTVVTYPTTTESALATSASANGGVRRKHNQGRLLGSAAVFVAAFVHIL